MSHAQIEELLPLYALDALRDEEIGEVERHLATCDACRTELDRHRHAAASLVPDAPSPPHLWDRIAGELGSAGEADGVATVRPMGGTGASTGRSSRWLAATAVAAAIAFGVVLVGQSTRSPEDAILVAADRASAQADTLSADFTVDDVTVARIVLTDDGRGFVIPTDSLEPLEGDRTYQLWVINAAEDVISAGVLGADPTPATFTWTGDVTGFALTREVAGGVVSSAGDVVSVITGL